ncbi:glycosyltransferase [Novosphingobium resinovorum]|uniref:glycosyltransferase n=1 Tax=Novosphingobium resinovorum TaxID=158500 RepID=UPI002ED172C7|nr:glycosyltransferase [Novosphingobium resinovorum]
MLLRNIFSETNLRRCPRVGATIKSCTWAGDSCCGEYARRPDSMRGVMVEVAHKEFLRSLVIVHVQTRMLTGGAEENTWASCVHQAGRGHIVHLVCGRDSNVDYYQSRNTSVRIHYVPELIREVSWRHDLAAYRRLTALFGDLQADIVHTHTSKAGAVGRFAARNAGVPAVVHGVHMLPFSNVGLAEKCVYLLAEHAVAPLTDHFVHVSHGTRRAYGHARIGSGRPHSVVRSGMDIERFRGSEWPQDWRQVMGVGPVAPKPRAILMLAALEKRKRHAEFIEGFMQELREGEDTRLLLAGDGPEAASIRELVASLGIADRVRLLGHRTDPERLVALADVCVLSSLREGLPRVIVQSLAGGRPAVVSPVRGIEEVVDCGVNGMIVRRSDAASIAREALKLVRDDDRLAAMTRAAQHAPVDEWTFAAMFEQLDRAYAAVLSAPRVRARLQRLQAEGLRASHAEYV